MDASTPDTVNLKALGLSKAEALVRLFNASRPLGLGFLQPHAAPMTTEEAEKLLRDYAYFDYIRGRVMKIDLSSDEVRVGLCDRDNGAGAALRALTDDGGQVG